MILKVIFVLCDQKGCQAEYSARGLSLSRTVQAATREGWTRTYGKYLCPTHRETVIDPDVPRETRAGSASPQVGTPTA